MYDATQRRACRARRRASTSEPSELWQDLLAKESLVRASTGPSVPRGNLSSHLRLRRSDRDALTREALRDLLVAVTATRLGVGPTGSFARDYAVCTDAEELARRLDDAADRLALTVRRALEPFLGAALARRGQLGEEVAAVARKRERIVGRGLLFPKPADAGVDLQVLSDWYEATFASLEEGGVEHASRLGFDSWEQFVAEIVSEYMDRSGAQGGC